MKLKTFSLLLLLVLALASCNTNRGVGSGNGGSGGGDDGGNPGDGDNGGIVDPIEEENLIGLPNPELGPIAGKKTFAVLEGTFKFNGDLGFSEKALFVVSEDGVFALNIANPSAPVWHTENLGGPLLTPIGASPIKNHPIVDAVTVLENDGNSSVYIILGQGGRWDKGYKLHNSGIISEFDRDDTYGMGGFFANKKRTSLTDSVSFHAYHPMFGYLNYYEIKDSVMKDKTPTAIGNSLSPNQIIGSFDSGNPTKPWYIVNTRSQDKVYQIWKETRDEGNPSEWGIPLEMPDANINLVGVIFDEKIIFADNGKSWKIDDDGSLTPYTIHHNITMNDFVVGAIPVSEAPGAPKITVIGTKQGFYEIVENDPGSSTPARLSAPINLVKDQSYRLLTSLEITGFYSYQSQTYITTSNGLFVLDHTLDRIYKL